MSDSDRMQELALRKQMLIQRSTVLRHTLAIQMDKQLAPVAGVADQAVAAGRWLRGHPYWLISGVVALAVWRPTGLTRVVSRGVWLWQAWQRWQPVVQPMLAQWRAALEQAESGSSSGGLDGSTQTTHLADPHNKGDQQACA